jgi:ribose transport system substrate-binding protein
MNSETFAKPDGLTRRSLLSAGAALAVAAAMNRPRAANAADLSFAAALGWTNYDSGRHMVNGYKDAVAKLGGNLTISDAGYDVKKQADQIASFVAAKPAAIFITPADPAGISPAVQAAVASGIPVFLADSYVPNATVTSVAMSNNFGLGYYTGDFIAKRLNGKGKIAAVVLPVNETWDERTLGLKAALLRYPDVQIAAEYSFANASGVTPRQAVDSLLTGHADLDAVWCGWDGAATEGALAIKAAGRPNVFTTGIDGGRQAFEYIKSGSPMVLTMAQSFYEMAYMNVLYAHEKLAGREAPRFIITATYPVTKDKLPGALPDNYDQPGEADKLGWQRVL